MTLFFVIGTNGLLFGGGALLKTEISVLKNAIEDLCSKNLDMDWRPST